MRVLIVSLSLVMFLFACKKEEQIEMQEDMEVLELKESPVSELTEEEKRLKTADRKLGWIMQDLEVPEYKLEKLAKKGEFVSDDYIKYANELITSLKKFKEIDHPDEVLVGLGNKMLVAMGEFESSITAKNPETIKKNWEILSQACAACHKDYKKGGGGY